VGIGISFSKGIRFAKVEDKGTADSPDFLASVAWVKVGWVPRNPPFLF